MMLMPSAITSNRVVIVPSGRTARGRGSAAVRRYRLARLRVYGQGHGAAGRAPDRGDESRFEHLRHIYD